MSRRFFYNSYQNAPLSSFSLGDTFAVTEQIHHHWCRVLRANIGDQAIFFDGFGGEYQVELIEINKKTAKVKWLAHSEVDNTPTIRTHIGLVMSRGERMDYAVQKATEMGVTAIQLLTSQHGEVRLKPAQIAKKLNHWQQVAISACEQCGMNRIPIILPPLPLLQWLEQVGNHELSTFSEVCDYIEPMLMDEFYQGLYQPFDLSLVLSVPRHNEPSADQALARILLTNQQTSVNNSPHSSHSPADKANDYPHICLLIGAEGGLSEEETEQAKSKDFKPWQIGNRVLRTETAPVAALATLHALNNIKCDINV